MPTGLTTDADRQIGVSCTLHHPPLVALTPAAGGATAPTKSYEEAGSGRFAAVARGLPAILSIRWSDVPATTPGA
jgi:hypothetical protein